MRISDWSSDVCSSDRAGQAIEEDIDGNAARRQPARELIAFLVDHDIAIAASGREDDRRAIGFGGAEDVEPRARDALEHPVAGVWIVAPLHGFFDEARGRNRSEEHTSELQSIMRISYAAFCWKKK